MKPIRNPRRFLEPGDVIAIRTGDKFTEATVSSVATDGVFCRGINGEIVGSPWDGVFVPLRQPTRVEAPPVEESAVTV